MSLIHQTTLALLLLASAGIAPGVASADASSRSEAIEEALSRNGGQGKVLGVRESRDDAGRVTWQVKVLTDGRVRIIRVKGR